MSCPDTPWRSA